MNYEIVVSLLDFTNLFVIDSFEKRDTESLFYKVNQRHKSI